MISMRLETYSGGECHSKQFNEVCTVVDVQKMVPLTLCESECDSALACMPLDVVVPV